MQHTAVGTNTRPVSPSWLLLPQREIGMLRTQPAAEHNHNSNEYRRMSSQNDIHETWELRSTKTLLNSGKRSWHALGSVSTFAFLCERCL